MSKIHETFRHSCLCICPICSHLFENRSTSKRFLEKQNQIVELVTASHWYLSQLVFKTPKPPGGEPLNTTEARQPLWPGERHRRGREHLLDAGAAAQSGTAQLHHPRHDVPDGEGSLGKEMGMGCMMIYDMLSYVISMWILLRGWKSWSAGHAPDFCSTFPFAPPSIQILRACHVDHCATTFRESSELLAWKSMRYCRQVKGIQRYSKVFFWILVAI